MAQQLKFRRVTTAQTSVFTGAEAEFTYDTQKKAIVTHDGSTIGGFTGGGFLQSGTGAETRSVESKLREFVSVKDFGATGDGSTDDTSAITSALNSGSTSVYFPNGTYKITGSIFCTVNNDLKIIGDGAKIDMDSVETGDMFDVTINAPIDIFSIEGLHLDGNGYAKAGIHVDCNAKAVQLLTIQNNFCEGFDNLTTVTSTYGIRVDALGAESVRIIGNRVYNVNRTQVNPGVSASVGIGVYDLVHGAVVSQNHIENVGSPVGDADADGVHVFSYNRLLTEHQTASPKIVENYFYNCKGRFVKLQCANAIVSNNHFEINNMETVAGFRYVDFQAGGGICANNIAFHNPAVGYGQEAIFTSCSLRSYAIHENVYIVSNNQITLEGDMYCFGFVFQDALGVSNGTVKFSDNIVTDRFDTYDVEFFTVLGIDNDIEFLDLTISNNQLGYLGSAGALFSFYGGSLADLADATTGPSIADKYKLSLINNSVRTEGAGIDLIDTQTSGGNALYMKHLMIRGNSNFTDSQVLAKGVDVNTLPQGTSFYFSTDGTASGGLVNAPVGFNRYQLVEKISHNFCRLTDLVGNEVALFRTDTSAGYKYTSTTALTF